MRPSTLAELAREFDAVSERAAELWHASRDPLAPAPGGGWSLAQCLSHLALSTRAYLPAWREALGDSAAPRRNDVRPLRLDLWGLVLCWYLAPPPKIKFRTKPGFEAPSTPGALEDFLASQRDLQHTIAQAEGLAIDRLRIRSAYDARVRYSVWSSLMTTLAHQRRHLWQAEAYRQAGGSTGSSSSR